MGHGADDSTDLAAEHAAALQESEDRFRGVFQFSAVGMALVAPDGRLLQVNPALCQMLGYAPDELLATSFPAITHPDDRKTDLGSMRLLLTGEIDSYQREKRYLHRHGYEIWALLSVSLVRDVQGNPRHFVCQVQDITESKQAEDNARRLIREQAARAEAEAANRAKDEFLAILSHELRTPLTPILWGIHLLRTGALDEDAAADTLETINRCAQGQAQLINDLVDVSRIITGKLHLEVLPLQWPSIVEAALRAARPAAEAKGIELRAVLDPRASPVSGDPQRLHQVAGNLLANAIKFTPPGGDVEVRLERIGSRAQFTVSDTGRGITAEVLPHIFERFRQADSSTTRGYGGLGLGLAIVRHLVELHGGTIEAASRGEGQGARFTVTLPLAVHPGLMEDPGMGDERSAIDHPGAALLDGMRVLCVEDEADTRKLLAMVLRESGAEVMVVDSSAQALDVLARWQPHVLVSDIGMPDEDGYTLIRKVRALESDRARRIPAVALTGYAGVEDRVRALAAGYQTHLPKPIEPVELMAVVANLGGAMEPGPGAAGPDRAP